MSWASLKFRGVYSYLSPPLRGGEKKSKNQKQGREIKGKERGNENEEGQKKGKKRGKREIVNSFPLIS